MNSLKVKYDFKHFESGEFISNGHWLVRKQFVESKPTDLRIADVDCTGVLPREIEGLLIDTQLVKHQIGSRTKERLFKTPQGSKIWLDESYYTMFAKGFPSQELYASPQPGPVIIMVGDEFLGLIMPKRVDKTIENHLS